MAKVFMIFFGLMVFVSCKEIENKTTLKKEVIAIKKVSDTQIVFQKIIDLPKFKKKTIATDSILTLAYKGADLGLMGKRYYDNITYRHVLSASNNFEDKRHIDKKHDSIRIPKLSYLSRDATLPKLHTIAEQLEKVIKVKNLFLKQEEALYALPIVIENRRFREVLKTQKLELLGASKILYECVSGIEQHENPPKKAIGQFRQVVKNLENITHGKIDDNGYAIDMVHQRLAHGLSNCIKWAKEEEY